MSLLSMLLGALQDDPRTQETIAAVYDLRDIHIDASIADDMPTAALANLLIEPTPAELDNPWTGYWDADGRWID